MAYVYKNVIRISIEMGQIVKIVMNHAEPAKIMQHV